ncbi:MAG: methyl-accepting chemotaxis protein [Rhodospirillales bacterium]|nr:methyl-accepting chemotaxis protein [Rhodospirillales bacterium]
MSGSSLSKSRAAIIVAGGTLPATAAVEFATQGLSPLGGAIAVAGVIAAVTALIFQGRATTSIRKTSDVCEAVAKGDFEARIIDIREGGDLGETMWKINELIDCTDAFVRESTASLQCVSNNKYYRRIASKGMLGSFGHAANTINTATDVMEQKVKNFSGVANNFEATIHNVVETVAAAATELQSTSHSMEGTAAATTNQARVVATAAESASTNVQTVAAAAEQLTSAIQEISRQLNYSTENTKAAMEQAEETNAKIAGLSEAAEKIGEVLQLISEIADQTNLLALNATIEAARAGEAGKGFAVVASEVKNLATQTARATEEIGTHIGGMQDATKEAVEAIQAITLTVTQISEGTSAIAAAVEQQGAATQEIARNVEEASTGTSEVTSNINSVTEAASETGQAAGEVLTAASELSRQAENMKGEIDVFLQEMRKVV